jgi:uncharacterized membrane protein
MQSSLAQAGGRVSRWLVPLAAGIVFFGFLMYAPEGLLGKADAIGYAVCHRIDLRSFHIGTRALPLCARCTGMYLGALLGLVYLGLTTHHRAGLPDKKMMILLGTFFLAFAVDGGNSYLYLLKQLSNGSFSQVPNLYVPNNTLRLLTGTGMGLVIAAVLAPAFNQSFWADWETGRIFSSWKHLLTLVGLALLLDLIVLADFAPVLLVLALLSAATVVLLLTMVYTLLVLMILRQENRFSSLPSAWLPFTSGFTIAMLQIIAIDILRLTLTGTWSGFPF